MDKNLCRLTLPLLFLGAMPLPLAAEGIPEPPVVFYGEVRNLVNGWNVRVTDGTLAWTFYPSDAGPPVVVNVALTNINDQFSYVLFLPCETIISPLSATTNSLRLLSPPSGPLTYTLNNVMVNGQPAYLKLPSQSPLWMTATNRGVLQRVDLTLQLNLVDSDGDGIPDAWERLYGLNPYNPADTLLDSDHDGLNNLQEYIAGTNPTNAQSAFAFIQVQPDASGGVRVDWSSASNRLYVLQRSQQLLSGFVDIKTDILSTPSVNTYRDATASGIGPYFYRLRIQTEPISTYDSDGNGLPDAWERLYFGRIRIDPNADADGDGASNLAEYQAGTNPTNAASIFRLIDISVAPTGGVNIEWSSVVNKHYTILWSADPQAGYDYLATGVPATPPINTFYDPELRSTLLYRVLVEP